MKRGVGGGSYIVFPKACWHPYESLEKLHLFLEARLRFSRGEQLGDSASYRQKEKVMFPGSDSKHIPPLN